MDTTALFMCLSLTMLGVCGVVAGVIHLCQDWRKMDGADRFVTIISILFCVGGMIAGLGPWN